MEDNNRDNNQDFTRRNLSDSSDSASSDGRSSRGFFSGGVNGRWSSIIILVMLIAAFLLYQTVFANNADCGGTPAKERLIGTPEPTEYFSGSSAWTANAENISIGLKTFYDTTGVAPYVYDISNEDTLSKDELQKIADDFYAEHFSDERHFLVVFQAGADPLAAYHVGSEAASIVDDSALSTFSKQLQSSMKDKNIKEEDMLVYVFITTSDMMMAGETNRWPLIIAILVVILVYGFYNYRRRLKQNGGQDDGTHSFF